MITQVLRVNTEDTIVLDPPSPYIEKYCYDVAQKLHRYLRDYRTCCPAAYRERYLAYVRKAVKHSEFMALTLYQLVNDEVPRNAYALIESKQHFEIAMNSLKMARLKCFPDDQQRAMRQAEVSLSKSLSFHLTNIYTLCTST